MPKVRRTEALDRAAAGHYRDKGDEYLAVAEQALADCRWNGAGLAAIHAGISLADAVLANASGIRSV